MNNNKEVKISKGNIVPTQPTTHEKIEYHYFTNGIHIFKKSGGFALFTRIFQFKPNESDTDAKEVTAYAKYFVKAVNEYDNLIQQLKDEQTRSISAEVALDFIEKERNKLRKQNSNLIEQNKQLLEVAKMVLNEWHSNDSNFLKEEPEYLEIARSAIKKSQAK